MYGETREFFPPGPPLYKKLYKESKGTLVGNLKITITLHYICASYRFSASFHAYLRPHSRRAEWAPFHCHRNVTEKKIQGVTPLNAISLWHAHAQKFSRLRWPLQKFSSLFKTEPLYEGRPKVILPLQVSSHDFEPTFIIFCHFVWIEEYWQTSPIKTIRQTFDS